MRNETIKSPTKSLISSVEIEWQFIIKWWSTSHILGTLRSNEEGVGGKRITTVCKMNIYNSWGFYIKKRID